MEQKNLKINYKNSQAELKQKQKNYKKQGKHTNITIFQKNLIKHLQTNPEVMVVQCDKISALVVIETTKYIERALNEHLLKKSTLQTTHLSRKHPH